LRAGQGLEAALSVTAWARRHRRRARFLLLNEIEALLEDPVPEPLHGRVQQQQAALDEAFDDYLALQRTKDRAAPPEAMARAKFLIFDGPIALLRPHLLADSSPPSFLDEMITDMHRGLDGDKPDQKIETGGGRRVA
jgi:hypothetical protein